MSKQLKLSILGSLIFAIAMLTITNWHWGGMGIAVFLLAYISKGMRRL
ncbi:MAG: hypothetical protein KME21_09280 [Desmonostoc vinosum HA7617-LM4]|jgi:hypothetical protein|nr:hypothetical protein [Desmonostoc vinosum HA7617-LM4]